MLGGEEVVGGGFDSEGANRESRIWTELGEDGGVGGWRSPWGKQAEEGRVSQLGAGSNGARRRAGAPPSIAKLKECCCCYFFTPIA